MKVAFATTDLVSVNDHFGWAKQFAIYEVSKEGFRLVEVVKTAEDPQGEDDKINAKIDAIRGSSIVYCQAIGATAAARVIKNRIHPMKVPEPVSIEEAAGALVKMLGSNPPPWIKRIVAEEAAND